MLIPKFTDEENKFISKLKEVSVGQSETLSESARSKIFFAAQQQSLKNKKSIILFARMRKVAALVVIITGSLFLVNRSLTKKVHDVKILIDNSSLYVWNSNFSKERILNKISYIDTRYRKKHATFQSRQRKWRRKLTTIKQRGNT